jgi:hypothetical protein
MLIGLASASPIGHPGRKLRVEALLYLGPRRAPRPKSVDLFAPGAVERSVRDEIAAVREEHAPRQIYVFPPGRRPRRIWTRGADDPVVVFILEHSTYDKRATTKRMGIAAIECRCDYCTEREERLVRDRLARARRKARKTVRLTGDTPSSPPCPLCGCTRRKPCIVLLPDNAGTAACVPAGWWGSRVCSKCDESA